MGPPVPAVGPTMAPPSTMRVEVPHGNTGETASGRAGASGEANGPGGGGVE